MKTIMSTLSQVVILLVLGLVVGLSINTVRGQDHINLFRVYFPRQAGADADDTAPGDADEPGDVTEPKDGPVAQDPPEEYRFQEVSLEEVVEIFADEKTAYGLYVFVDARADEPYKEGHIPGAMQCDYYRIEHYFPDLMTRAAGAEKIVVYCNGADCEDSLYVSGELLQADIPKASILLFKGGWEAWREADLPCSNGRE